MGNKEAMQYERIISLILYNQTLYIRGSMGLRGVMIKIYLYFR